MYDFTKALKETLIQIGPLDSFEFRAALYYKRFGRLAPGKSEAPATGRVSHDPENFQQWDKYRKSGLEDLDILAEALKLQPKLEKALSALVDADVQD